jgi:hypothetical protein
VSPWVSSAKKTIGAWWSTIYRYRNAGAGTFFSGFSLICYGIIKKAMGSYVKILIGRAHAMLNPIYENYREMVLGIGAVMMK